MAKRLNTAPRAAKPSAITSRPRGRPPGKTSNQRGRPPGSDLLTPARARLALRLQAEGSSYEQIAAHFKCSIRYVGRMLTMARQLETEPMTTDAQEFSLTRTGSAPLKFNGTLRAEVSSQFIHTRPERPNKDVWTIAIYDIASGGHVVAIHYRKTHRDRIVDHYFADFTHDVEQTLRAYDPLAALCGFPPGPQFADSQLALEQASRRQYDALISDALLQFPKSIEPDTEANCALPEVFQALNELADAARPFIAMNNQDSVRLATAVRALSTVLQKTG